MEGKNKEDNIYCNNCGNKINKDNSFCSNCGKKIESNDVNVTYEENKKDDSIKVTYEPKSEDYSVLKNHNERKNNINNRNTILPLVITSMVTIVICMFFVFIYCTFFISKGTNTTKLEKDVTVTDKGIADAVEKIYDAVVVVENYANGKLQSTGTGFVYKKEKDKAYILTNNHVVNDASEVYVILTDDSKVKVDFVNGDPYSDIAVLSMNASKAKEVATIGRSTELRVGDTTFAVGAPIDASTYSWTVTRGILSGKDRLVEVSSNNSMSNDYVIKVLQTDTAINSGNSGGPLCNSNGEVIGITNMKVAASTVEGMGFAIPIETAITYADKYISGEKDSRPYLGVSMYNVTSRYDSIAGVYIQSVESNGPAAKAGLRKGDVITKIGDVEVKSSAYLKYELYKHNVGDKITITYIRDNKDHKATVILGKYESNS